jgi:hypothetical protein
LIEAAERLPHMPMFNNLTDLVFFKGSPVDLDCVGLLRILQNSPCLKTMKFVEVTLFVLKVYPFHLIADLSVWLKLYFCNDTLGDQPVIGMGEQ